MEFDDEGIRYPHIAKQHFERAQKAYIYLSEEDKIPHDGKPENAPRHNPKRMQFIENACVSIISCAAAIEAQILLYSTSIYNRLRANYNYRGIAGDLAGRFAATFIAKKELKTLPLKPKVHVFSANARSLHKLGEALACVLGDDDWPTDSYDELAEVRNTLVHRTVFILREDLSNLDAPSAISMLEDADPDVLSQQMKIAFSTMEKCWSSMGKTLPKSFVPTVAQVEKICDIAGT